jgi:hypothetical protein
MYIDEGTNKLFQIKIKLEIFNINLLDWIFFTSSPSMQTQSHSGLQWNCEIKLIWKKSFKC